MILTCRLHRINRYNSRHGVSRQPHATIIKPLSTAALRHRDRFSGHAKPQLPQCAKPMRNGYLSALRKAVTALHKYAENGMRKWINIQHNSKIRAFFRPTAPSVANTRVLKVFCYLLDRQQFTHYGNLKTNLRVCKRAHFGLRYRLFQAPIWCISCPDMVHFANRKSPFRKTTVFLRRFDKEKTGAEKAL